MEHERELMRALCSKYESLRALRALAQPVPPRARLAELAARFPGALRELDQLPLDVIDTRLQELHWALADGSPPQLWMRLQISYHGFMRAVLRIRRSCQGQTHTIVDAQAELARIAYEPEPDEPHASRFDIDALYCIRRPPAGRLNPWVFEQVARDHGVSVRAVQAALFPE